MPIAVKIIIGVIALAALLAGGFYLWLLIAFTPPKVKASTYVQETVKSGVIGKFQFVISYTAPDKDAPRTYFVDTGPATDDLSAVPILQVAGRPVPVDVTMEKSGYVTVLFDGALADGKTTLDIKVDGERRREAPLQMENGAVR